MLKRLRLDHFHPEIEQLCLGDGLMKVWLWLIRVDRTVSGSKPSSVSTPKGEISSDSPIATTKQFCC